MVSLNVCGWMLMIGTEDLAALRGDVCAEVSVMHYMQCWSICAETLGLVYNKALL